MKKSFVVLILPCLALIFQPVVKRASAANCPTGAICTQYNGTVPYGAVGGSTARAPAGRANDAGSNILEFGADPTGTNDSTAAIQAAIDAVASSSTAARTTFCPEGFYKTSLPIFNDPPGNLRGADGAHGASYQSGQTYSLGQTVNYSGTAYISLQNNNVGNTPSSSLSYWQVFAYNGSTTYASGAIVSYSGVPWVSLQNSNTRNTPGTGSSYWSLTTATETNYNFSLSFRGNPGLGSEQNGKGCILKPTFNNGPAFWSGTGQGMYVGHIEIQGPSGRYKGQQPSNGIGIAIAGGSGGASRTMVEDVGVENEYTCFRTGANSDSLADSNTFLKVDCSNCFWGVWISQTQNDINDVIDPTLSCTNAFYAPMGPGLHVWGGNPSAASSVSNSFTISSVSALTAAVCYANNYCYTFQATISSPDQYVGTVYNSYVISTVGFGLIPMTLSSYNSSTHVGTFAINTTWGGFYFQGGINAAASTDLQAQIEAATTIYAAERVTVFWGQGIYAVGQHIENNNCTTLVDGGQGFVGDLGIELTKLRFNYDPGLTQWKPANSPTAAQLAQFYCQQAFGFIIEETSGHDLSIDDSSFGQSLTSEPVTIQWGSFDSQARLTFKNLDFSLVAPNVQTTGAWQNGGSAGPISGGQTVSYCAACGAGEWDKSPFIPHYSGNNNLVDFQYRTAGPLSSPFIGFYPAPWTHPRLTPSDITTLTGSLGALSSYPIIAGNTIYSQLDWNTGAATYLFARSAHIGFSYGQNLTTSNITGLSWSYDGQSFVVSLDATSIQYMQAGLEIGLNNGSGSEPYIVTGVFPGLGYITVQQSSNNTTCCGNALAGTKGTTYTGTTVGQESYSITQY
jgi:hypothetical protein